jgi:hypothetical protein
MFKVPPSSLAMAVQSYWPDLGYDGWTQDIKFGDNDSVGVVPQPIWSEGTTYTPATVAEPLEVVSDSAEDAPGGLGAARIKMQVINEDFDQEFVTADLDGTTPVPLGLSGFACNRAFLVYYPGQNNRNIGDIDVRGVTTGNVYAHIAPLQGQTLQCIVRVPRNTACIIDGYRVSVESNKTVTFEGIGRSGCDENGNFLNGDLGPERVAVIHRAIVGTVSLMPHNFRVFPEGSLLWAQASVASQTASVSCDFDYYFHKYKS